MIPYVYLADERVAFTVENCFKLSKDTIEVYQPKASFGFHSSSSHSIIFLAVFSALNAIFCIITAFYLYIFQGYIRVKKEGSQCKQAYTFLGYFLLVNHVPVKILKVQT